MSFTVAIDGPAAAGKGTISKALAAHYGFAHLDTGLLYRAVGKKALLKNAFTEEAVTQLARDLTLADLVSDDLRTPQVAQAASKIAVIPEVREALVQFQKIFAKQEGGAVLDGRDIGTVICPDANVKLFITASVEIRAKRRYKELSEKGQDVTLTQVIEDVVARDERDASREVAPMIAADDAHQIDTSHMSIKGAITAAVMVIDAQYLGR